MTKDLIIIGLGVWIAVLPFLGFPNTWDRALLLVSGVSVSILMFLLRRDFFTYVERLRRKKDREKHTDTYVENNEIHTDVSSPTPTSGEGVAASTPAFSAPEAIIETPSHEEIRKSRRTRRTL